MEFQNNPNIELVSKLKEEFEYDNMKGKLGNMPRNGIISDENSRPGKERISIDDDSFNTDEVFATIKNRDTMRIIPEITYEKYFPTPSTVSIINYADPSPKYKKKDREIRYFRNQRETMLENEKDDSVIPSRKENLRRVTTVESDPENGTYIENVSDKNFERTITTSPENIHENHNLIKSTSSNFSEQLSTEEYVMQIENTSEQSSEFYEKELKIEKLFDSDKIFNDSSISIKNYTESNDKLKSEEENLEEEKELEILRRSGNENEKNNISKSFREEFGPQEEKSVRKEEESTKDVFQSQRTSKGYTNVPTLSTLENEDPEKQPTIGPVVVFSKGNLN